MVGTRGYSLMRLRKLIVALAIFASVFSSSVVFMPQVANAANGAFCQREIGGFLSFPTWYKYLTFTPGDANCNIDFDITKDSPKVALAIFEIVLRIGGIVAVVFVIYGGFLYLTSQGEPDRAKNARTTIINALAGLVITTLSVAIVNLIARNIA